MNNKEKAQWLADFYQESADNDNGFTCDESLVFGGPNMHSNFNRWKVREPKQNELDNLFKEFDAVVEKIECYREK